VIEDNRSDDDRHDDGGEWGSELGHGFLLMWVYVVFGQGPSVQGCLESVESDNAYTASPYRLRP
jgi:hypothetical protein